MVRDRRLRQVEVADHVADTGRTLLRAHQPQDLEPCRVSERLENGDDPVLAARCSTEPVLDRLWRGVLILAYRALSVYWRLFRPRTAGVCVLVWHEFVFAGVSHSSRRHEVPPALL